jgi:hypothetical protein
MGYLWKTEKYMILLKRLAGIVQFEDFLYNRKGFSYLGLTLLMSVVRDHGLYSTRCMKEFKISSFNIRIFRSLFHLGI